jgi:hypothetical protein
MAKQTIQQDAHVSNIKKIGKPRTSKIFRKKGNKPSVTSRKGNGKRIK